jgi:hypothetical protein
MDQTIWRQEDAPFLPMAFHEGHRDILDGVGDMDDIFGIRQEKDDHKHKEKELDNKKIKDQGNEEKQTKKVPINKRWWKAK